MNLSELKEEVENKIDWRKFLRDVKNALNGKAYYIKKDLAAYEL